MEMAYEFIPSHLYLSVPAEPNISSLFFWQFQTPLLCNLDIPAFFNRNQLLI